MTVTLTDLGTGRPFTLRARYLVGWEGGRSPTRKAIGSTFSGDEVVQVQATDFSAFVHALPRLASRHGIRLLEVRPADESLESVFSYLVAR